MWLYPFSCVSSLLVHYNHHPLHQLLRVSTASLMIWDVVSPFHTYHIHISPSWLPPFLSRRCCLLFVVFVNVCCRVIACLVIVVVSCCVRHALRVWKPTVNGWVGLVELNIGKKPSGAFPTPITISTTQPHLPLYLFSSWHIRLAATTILHYRCLPTLTPCFASSILRGRRFLYPHISSIINYTRLV